MQNFIGTQESITFVARKIVLLSCKKNNIFKKVFVNAK